MKTITFSDVDEPDRLFVNGVRAALCSLQSPNFVSKNAELGAWLDERFPEWEKRYLLPFILSRSGSVPLFSKQHVPEEHILVWLDGETVSTLNDEEGNRELVKRGLVIVGTDAEDSYICIDTRSASTFDVVVVDTDSLAGDGFSEEALEHTQQKVDEFLKWCDEYPVEILNFWDRKFEGESD